MVGNLMEVAWWWNSPKGGFMSTGGLVYPMGIGAERHVSQAEFMELQKSERRHILFTEQEASSKKCCHGCLVHASRTHVNLCSGVINVALLLFFCFSYNFLSMKIDKHVL